MARFDIYRNAGAHQAVTPYLIDVQSNVLEPLNTRVVIPMRRLDHFAQVGSNSKECTESTSWRH